MQKKPKSVANASSILISVQKSRKNWAGFFMTQILIKNCKILPISYSILKD